MTVPGLTSDDLVLVTGAGGKVGRALVRDLLADPEGPRLRSLTLSTELPASPRLEQMHGDIAERDVVRAAMDGVTHVVHLATCKEDPARVIDVTVRGLFWLLEEARATSLLRRFLLLGGDAAIGHYFDPYDAPVPDDALPRPYPGCYALSKVLEETLLAQYATQYDVDTCCLRVPWIMADDDLRFAMSFGPDVFGGPRWAELVPTDVAAAAYAEGAVPLALAADGQPLRRNVIHVDDVVSAITLALVRPEARQQVMNVAIAPLDYGEVAAHLAGSRHLRSVEVATPYYSVELSSDKARKLLGWAPRFDPIGIVDAAWDFRRDPADVREVRYPG